MKEKDWDYIAKVEKVISKKYGKPISLVRFTIEFSVVLVGWILGGTLGIGTIIFAVFIGPFVSISLKLVSSLYK